MFYNMMFRDVFSFVVFFFFKQKTAYEMRISDWSSDVCSSDLEGVPEKPFIQPEGIVSIRIDAQTGLLASASTDDVLFEYFRSENVPTEEEIGRASCRERVCQYV